ncbi:Uncharacterised protein [Streptococcus pneumoniae]|nr:Uncharacterised protein [Streptococcus pneumoniae]
MDYKVYKACKVHEVNKVFLDLEGQMEEPSTLILLTQIMQLEEVLAKLIPISHILVCMSILMLQTAEILLIIAGQDGKVVMAQMAWQVGLVQMVGHHTYI